MKVLFDHSSPFLLAHGGFQTQIEQTKAALESVGVEVEFLRWWDDAQEGDIIHFFGRPTGVYVDLAHKKNIRVVVAELLTGLGSRSNSARFVQKVLMISARSLLTTAFTARLGWESYVMADACVALTLWERQLMIEMFSAPPERVHCVPNGVEEIFLESQARPRGKWLVCTATVTERKRVLELAEAAIKAQTPVWIIGKPYSESDPYAVRFLQIARTHPSVVRYDGSIGDRKRMAEIYREARGFVLLSAMESLSLSTLEAAACHCPLLLSDLPWARCSFQQNVSYCPATASTKQTAEVLRRFYDAAPGLPRPAIPLSWISVANQLVKIYKSLLNTS